MKGPSRIKILSAAFGGPYIGVWLAFAILCSVVLRRAATAALAAISAWIVLTLFGTFSPDW